jgi:hypothetical protein
MAEPVDAAALRALEQRLDRATAAAERLLSEAGACAGAGAGAAGSADSAAGAGVPERGWQRAGADAAPGDWVEPGDAELLLSLLSGVRDRIPVELQQRLVAALREVLQALRALIDWCLERAERRAATPAEVQDIPIL